MNRTDPSTRSPFNVQAFVSLISDALLVLAVVLLFIEDGKRYSAGATTLWLAIETLRLSGARPWSLGALSILALNVRGIVLEDGPTPVSHMDYVVIIIAVLVGFGRDAAHWRRTAALVSGACLLGVLLNAEVIFDFAWWSIEYQAQSLTKNSTALLAGIGALSGVMAALLGRHQWRWWLPMIPCILASLVLAKATTSRAALGLVPLALLLAGLLISRDRLSSAFRTRLSALSPPSAAGSAWPPCWCLSHWWRSPWWWRSRHREACCAGSAASTGRRTSPATSAGCGCGSAISGCRSKVRTASSMGSVFRTPGSSGAPRR